MNVTWGSTLVNLHDMQLEMKPGTKGFENECYLGEYIGELTYAIRNETGNQRTKQYLREQAL